jgi:hypothetical protein
MWWRLLWGLGCGLLAIAGGAAPSQAQPLTTLQASGRAPDAPDLAAGFCPDFGRWSTEAAAMRGTPVDATQPVLHRLLAIKSSRAALDLRAVNLDVFGAPSWIDRSIQRFEIGLPEALNEARLDLLVAMIWHGSEEKGAPGPATIQVPVIERLQDARDPVPGGAGNDRKRTLKLEIRMPSNPNGHGWRPASDPASVVVIGCQGGQFAFLAARRAGVIALEPARRVALIALVLIYLIASLVSPGARAVRQSADAPRMLKLRSWFDPVLITQDEHGFGSLRRLQLFYFTFVIFGLSLYILLRAGYLSPISEQLLWLMGIAASGTAFASLADRLRAPEEGGAASRGPTLELMRFLARSGVMPKRDQFGSWLEVVTEGPGLGVHRLQVVIFSLLVGVFIVDQGSESLAALKIPDSYLMLIGLSQAVYVSVYATSPRQDWGAVHDAAARYRAAVPDWQTRTTPLDAAQRDAWLALRPAAGAVLPRLAPER